MFKTFTSMASAIVLCCSLYSCTTAFMEVFHLHRHHNHHHHHEQFCVCFKKNSRGSLPIFHVSFSLWFEIIYNTQNNNNKQQSKPKNFRERNHVFMPLFLWTARKGTALVMKLSSPLFVCSRSTI